AITKKNGLAISDPRRLRLSNTINQLMDSRTDLHIQELKAGLDSAQLAAALAKITTASQDLKTEAAKMKNVTSYINNANAVIGAATKVTNIVKNGGEAPPARAGPRHGRAKKKRKKSWILHNLPRGESDPL